MKIFPQIHTRRIAPLNLLAVLILSVLFLVSCSSGNSKKTPINNPPTVTLSADNLTGATPLTVNFTADAADADNDNLTFSWDFGDNSTVSIQALKEQGHTYDAGTFTAKVTVSDGKGGIASDSIEITALIPPKNNPPTVSLTATPTDGLAPLEVEFVATASDPDGGLLLYSWDFGDGTILPGATQRKHTYQKAGTYTAKITVSDDEGKTDSDSKDIIVTTTANSEPTVILIADKATGTVPLIVNFTANATDVDNDNLTFSWDFGDGQTLDVQAAEAQKEQGHTYNQVGTYTAKVTVSDGKENSVSDSVEIIVESLPQNKPPTVSLDANNTSGEAPLNVEFTTTSNDPDGDSLTYSWNFGDGDKTGNKDKETHTYQNAGTFTAKVTVSDGKGGTDSDSVEVTVKEPLPPIGQLTILEGSKNTTCSILDEIRIYGEVLNNSAKSYYSIEVKATVRNAAGNVIDISSGFVKGSPVKSSLSTISSGLPANTKGVFQILTDAPCTEFDTFSLQISKKTEGTNNVKGDIKLAGQVRQSTDTLGFVDLIGEVENKGSVRTKFTQVYGAFKDDKGKIVDIDFTFVDGSTCPTTIGTTDTCVEVGAKEPFEMSTVIKPSEFSTVEYYFDWSESETGGNNNSNPTVTLKANKTSGTAPLEVSFTTTSSDPDNDSLTFSWDFGNGQTAQGQKSRNNTYQNAGVFTTKVTVSDGKGGTQNDSIEIIVDPAPKNSPPTVSLDANSTSGETPLSVKFTVTANDPDGDVLTYNWNFGDGKTASGQTQRNHTYFSKGTYSPKIIVSDGKNPTVIVSKTISVTSPTPPPKTCCKVCRTGKACGDSCISKSKTCTKIGGCACNGTSSSLLTLLKQQLTQPTLVCDVVKEQEVCPAP